MRVVDAVANHQLDVPSWQLQRLGIEVVGQPQQGRQRPDVADTPGLRAKMHARSRTRFDLVRLLHNAECLNAHRFMSVDDARENARLGVEITTRSVLTARKP